MKTFLMDMILFRVSIQRFLVIPMRSKWDGESFPLECPNPLSFSNSPSTPFSISFCKNINLFPQGVNCGCLHLHGSWRVDCILKWGKFLWLHSFSALIFCPFTLPPWLPPLFSPIQSKPFQDRLSSSCSALVPSAFIC